VRAAVGERRVGELRTHAAGYSELLRLSWPIMLSQVLVTAVSLIDIAMVGRLGPKAVAAVGYATQFFFMTQSALFAVGFACVALMARAIGAGDPAEARRSLAASLVVGVGTAVLVGAAVLAAPARLLALLNAEPEVITMTVPYMRLVLASTLMLAISLVLENGMRADRDMVRPMIIASAVAALKIWLNAYLIFGRWGGPRLELIGAGIATFVSQAFGLVLFVLVIARAPKGSPLALTRADLAVPLTLIRRVVRVAAPGVAERIVLNLALLDYFAILGNYGTVVGRGLHGRGAGALVLVDSGHGHRRGGRDARGPRARLQATSKKPCASGRRSALLAIAVAIVLGSRRRGRAHADRALLHRGRGDHSLRSGRSSCASRSRSRCCSSTSRWPGCTAGPATPGRRSSRRPSGTGAFACRSPHSSRTCCTRASRGCGSRSSSTTSHAQRG
jgi:hypothetical protein